MYKIPDLEFENNKISATKEKLDQINFKFFSTKRRSLQIEENENEIS